MTPHKYAELLRYAADNADALFVSELYEEAFAECKRSPTKIGSVISYAGFDDWQIYKEPVTQIVWYERDTAGNILPFDSAPDLEQWFMKITYIDGKPTNPVFSEDSK